MLKRNASADDVVTELERSGKIRDRAPTKPVMRFGGMRRRNLPIAANDNASNGGKVVRLVAHNCGCSTTSGMVPVSLPRVSAIDEVAA